jgi:hypothetical protein
MVSIPIAQAPVLMSDRAGLEWRFPEGYAAAVTGPGFASVSKAGLEELIEDMTSWGRTFGIQTGDA